MIQKLPIRIDTLSRIFHTADIHIRLFKRRFEYRDVFQTLYQEIKNENLDNSIMVIAGDIVHAKTEMSPELIDLTSDLFKNLADILPTVVIAGNHDANLNNMSRLDALSPIIKTLNHSNLHYLRDTGLYQIGDTIFSVMSVFDKIPNYYLAETITSDLTKVAIFHGPIYNSTTDTKWKITNEKVQTNLFDGFDIVLLGDIHKYQTLQPYGIYNGIKKPCMAYPSSLIQQNFGESTDKHGMLIWDVKNKTHEFKKVKNSHGFVTFEIDNGVIVSDIPEMPEKPKVRLMIRNSTPSQIKECISDIRHKYKPLEVISNKTNSKTKLNDASNRVNLSKIRDVDFQNKIIEDYFKRNDYMLDENALNKIYEINKLLNSNLPIEDITRNVTWKPKTFKFSNMFSYGEGNIVDFSKMNGLVGLFSTNASGKTSLLESLTFCLFDKCSKTFKAANILNNRKDEFFCELQLEISGEEYVITRRANRTSTGNVNVKVDFYKIMPDGKPFSLNGEHRRDTDSIIRSYIGTYEDFILTAVSSQNNTANFIDKSQTERKDLLSAFMDITIFDKLYEMGSDNIKEYQVLLKEYEKNDYEGEILECAGKIDRYNNEYSMLKLSKDSLVQEKKKIDDCILRETKQLIKIDVSVVDIDTLEKDKTSLEVRIKDEEKNINTTSSNILKTKSFISNISDNIQRFKDEDIEHLYQHFTELESNLSKIDSDVEKFKVEVGHKMEKTKKLRDLEYDPKCKYCMNNIFVKDAIVAKEELESDRSRAKEISEKRNSTVAEIKSMPDIKDKYETYTSEMSEFKKLNIDLLKLDSQSSSLENKINMLKSDYQKTCKNIDIYYKSKEDIEKNKIIESKISKLKLETSNLNSELVEMEDELRETHSKLVFLEDKKKSLIESLNKFKDMEEKFVSYQYYLQATHRDSIPYELISEAIPSIETEVNNILAQIVDFAIMLELDGKNINAKIVYDEHKVWPLEMASGMEKFITGMAIRVALVDITNLPKPNFLAIDEGFSSLDADNISNLPTAFDYFKSQFDFVFVISHMDYIRDFADISLDLRQEDDFSKITFK